MRYILLIFFMIPMGRCSAMSIGSALISDTRWCRDPKTDNIWLVCLNQFEPGVEKYRLENDLLNANSQTATGRWCATASSTESIEYKYARQERALYDLEEFKRQFAKLYKIHLMPKPGFLITAARLLADTACADPLCRQLFYGAKIINSTLETNAVVFAALSKRRLVDSTGNIYPFIVLYPRAEAVPEALEYIVRLMQGIPALTLGDLPTKLKTALIKRGTRMGEILSERSPVIPRFNVRACLAGEDSGDFAPVFYAQGNGDKKIDRAVVSTDSRLFDYVKPAIGGDVVMNEKEQIVYGRITDLLYDPKTNYALVRPDFFGPDQQKDFHVQIPCLKCDDSCAASSCAVVGVPNIFLLDARVCSAFDPVSDAGVFCLLEKQADRQYVLELYAWLIADAASHGKHVAASAFRKRLMVLVSKAPGCS